MEIVIIFLNYIIITTKHNNKVNKNVLLNKNIIVIRATFMLFHMYII